MLHMTENECNVEGTASARKLPETTESLVVLEFKSCEEYPSLKKWILEKVKNEKCSIDIVHQSERGLPPNQREHEKCIVHLGMSTENLLRIADVMMLKRTTINKKQNEEELTMAHKQRVVLHELESIRVAESESLPKHKHKTQEQYPMSIGEAILPRCRSDGVVDYFPLHNKMDIAALGAKWYSYKNFFHFQPIDDIQSYFGVKIAMYFAFLEFYTLFLAIPALLGLLSCLPVFGDGFLLNYVPIFSVFNIICVTIFLELWKRHSAHLAYNWGIIHLESFEEPQALHCGVLGTNPVTDRKEWQYSRGERLVKFYCVTVPFVGISLFLALVVMLVYFRMEDMVKGVRESKWKILWKCVPTIVYTLVVMSLNAVYRNLAIRINNWENHRLLSSYDNHLRIKLVLFDFTNCFSWLFYAAFYIQDLQYLRKALGIQLIVLQVVQQIQEVVLPHVVYKFKRSSVEKQQPEGTGLNSDTWKQTEIEILKQAHPGTLDDYLEMFIQFGYVFLFSAVFPSAAFWALLNNLTEIRTDAFKLCRTYRRPFALPASSIGVWEPFFQILTVVAVITNLSLIYLSPLGQTYQDEFGPTRTILFFVVVEHIIIATKVLIMVLIPDMSKDISIGLAKEEFVAKRISIAHRLKETSATKIPENKSGKRD